jgi:hypothetical protein
MLVAEKTGMCGFITLNMVILILCTKLRGRDSVLSSRVRCSASVYFRNIRHGGCGMDGFCYATKVLEERMIVGIKERRCKIVMGS